MFLEHSNQHDIASANQADYFDVELHALSAMLEHLGRDNFKICDVLRLGDHNEAGSTHKVHSQPFIVVEKLKAAD
jgi:hypothetical protein